MVKKKTSKKKQTKKAAQKKATKKKKTSSKKTTKKKLVKKAKKTTKKVAKKAVKKKATKKKAVRKTSAKKTTTKKVAVKKPVDKPVKYGLIYKGLSEGDQVKDFQLEATGDKKVSLSDLKGQKFVLFFYPKDATPGCTVEAQDFTQLHSKFAEKNIAVFGVSRDSIKSHEKFKEKQNYSVDLISDPEEELCRLFGVMKLKNMYGKPVRGIERSTFLVNEEGQVEKEWRNVKVPGHAEEVLAYIKK